MAPKELTRPAAYSVAEAGRQLAVSRSQVYNLAKAGKLRILKIGNRSVVRSEDVDRLLDEAAELFPPAS